VRRPPLAPFAVLAALAALVGIGTAVQPAPPAAPPAARGVPVVGTRAVCPDLLQEDGRTTTRVSVGAVPGLDGPPSDGARDVRDPGVVTVAPLSGAARAGVLPLQGPGQVAPDLGAEVTGDALVVTASGPLAAGLEVEQVGVTLSGGARGLTGLRCTAASSEAWFLGGATVVGQSALLLLVNPDATAAVVDVDVTSRQGRAGGRPGDGVVVPARSRVLLPMDELAPARDGLAVHVVATRGRITAALRHDRSDGAVPLGSEWVPQSGPPSAQVVVPGVPQGPGVRLLLVNAPGPVGTTVSVQVTTGGGQFVPSGLGAVAVPAGSTVGVPLTGVVAGASAALRVRSAAGVPVLASVLVEDAQEGPVREISYAGAAEALDGPALLTDLALDRSTESTLLLSALGGDADVEVTPVPVLGAAGPVAAPRTVRVPGGTTVPVRLSTLLPPGAVDRLAVEVRATDGSGPVYAARYLRRRGADGPFTTLLPLRGAAQQVRRPAVAADPAVGAGREPG